MQGPVRGITVRQLYHRNISSLSNFVCDCNDSVLPVTLNPLAEVQASISSAAPLYPTV
jgi:hypothetical protein